MPAGEVMPAMERGVIDACEFANFFGDVELGFADVAKYVYFNPYSSAPCNLMFFINKKDWAKVPDDLKKQIKEAAFESMKWSLAECLFLDFLAMRKAEKVLKAKVAIIPMEVGKFIHEKAAEFYAKKAKEDPEMAEYMKYHDEFFGRRLRQIREIRKRPAVIKGNSSAVSRQQGCWRETAITAPVKE
jgi:TRAP-type mannitol/chloroaromatic compound transport system substrate-binding protein